MRDRTRVDTLLAHLKNNRIAASIIVVGTIVVALAAFTDAVHRILSLLPARTPLLTCAAGQWSTGVILNPQVEDDRFKYTMSLSVLGDEVVGRLRETSLRGDYDVVSSIADGQTNGSHVYFVVTDVWDIEGQKVPVRRSFDGNVSRDEIRFVESNDRGSKPRDFVANCVGDAASQGSSR